MFSRIGPVSELVASINVADLVSKTSDNRERKYIDDRLQALKSLISKKIDQESKIFFNKETGKYGKGYQEQILDLKEAARKNS